MYVNQARLSSTLQNPSLKKYDHVNIWMQEALSFVQDKFDLNPRFQRKGQREAYDRGSEASNKYCAFIYVFLFVWCAHAIRQPNNDWHIHDAVFNE